MEKTKPVSRVSAIVLAAGSSTRMGTVKPLIAVGGRPMLERVLSTLRESAVDEILVVLGHSAALIQQTVQFGKASALINNEYREGIASSLRIGIARVSPEAEAALIVLADQPFLKAATLDLLIREYQSKRPRIVIPLHGGVRGNPVLLDRSVFSEAAGLTGDIGFRALFAKHGDEVLKLPVDDPGVLIDLDTAADVEKWAKPET